MNQPLNILDAVGRDPMEQQQSLETGLSGAMPISDSYSYSQQMQRQRQMTLGDLLLENRIVFLQGEIYAGNANDIGMKLLYLQKENKKKDIHFYLNSPGGDVIATLAIYDVMQILTCPVATYCVGQCASGAAVLLAGCLLYTSPSPRDATLSRMPSSA